MIFVSLSEFIFFFFLGMSFYWSMESHRADRVVFCRQSFISFHFSFISPDLYRPILSMSFISSGIFLFITFCSLVSDRVLRGLDIVFWMHKCFCGKTNKPSTTTKLYCTCMTETTSTKTGLN